MEICFGIWQDRFGIDHQRAGETRNQDTGKHKTTYKTIMGNNRTRRNIRDALALEMLLQTSNINVKNTSKRNQSHTKTNKGRTETTANPKHRGG